VLGAGACGMMRAIEESKRGRSVLVIDHAKAPGEKIRISGGGGSNFTNVNTRPDQFISQKPALRDPGRGVFSIALLAGSGRTLGALTPGVRGRRGDRSQYRGC
jgi:predicted flavoprotein YhiN